VTFNPERLVRRLVDLAIALSLGPSMTLEETLSQLEALGTEKMRLQNTRHGAGDNQFGVRLGDIRKLAKKIKRNHALGLAL
jgi:3-methyladenine DNA glycosylase AlkD